MALANPSPDEADRLAALRAFDLLDRDSEPAFDRIVGLAMSALSVPMAAVRLLDADRQWFRAECGSGLCETPRADALDRLAIAAPAAFVVEDTAADERFSDNASVANVGGVRFYAGAPVHDPEGHRIGTLCVFDTEPRTFDDRARDMLLAMADQVTDQIALRCCLMEAEQTRQRMRKHREDLEREVDARTEEVVQTREEVVRCLARAAEYRDDDTGHHVRRVSLYVETICKEIGFDADRASIVALASTLHDVGKIGIPDAILLKPGRLTAEEFAHMQEHVTHGREIIENLSDNDDDIQLHCEIGAKIIGHSDFQLLDVAARIAESHHERFDGSGYPHGLAGEDIPIEGRIVAVADVFDALCSARPYKPAFDIAKARAILEDARGSHFDPHILDAFFARFDHILEIRNAYTDQPLADAA